MGTSYPIPVEITPTFAQRTVRRIAALPALAGCNARIRKGSAPAGLPGANDSLMPFTTDNGVASSLVQQPVERASSHVAVNRQPDRRHRPQGAAR